MCDEPLPEPRHDMLRAAEDHHGVRHETPGSPSTTDPHPHEPSLADDILEGAEEIARFLWNDPRKRVKIYRHRRKSRMPLFKMGAKICARKSTLRDWIKMQEDKGWRTDL